MIKLPETLPEPEPSTNAVWLDVESSVTLPPQFKVPLLFNIAFMLCPDALAVVVLPDATVKLLNVVAVLPLIDCVVPLNTTVPPLAVNEPLLVKLF